MTGSERAGFLIFYCFLALGLNTSPGRCHIFVIASDLVGRWDIAQSTSLVGEARFFFFSFLPSRVCFLLPLISCMFSDTIFVHRDTYLDLVVEEPTGIILYSSARVLGCIHKNRKTQPLFP